MRLHERLAAIRAARLDAVNKSILSVLAGYAGDDEERPVWPSVVTIASDAGVNKDTVTARMAALGALGLIVCVQKHRMGHNARYRVAWDLVAAADARPARRSTFEHPTRPDPTPPDPTGSDEAPVPVEPQDPTPSDTKIRPGRTGRSDAIGPEDPTASDRTIHMNHPSENRSGEPSIGHARETPTPVPSSTPLAPPATPAETSPLPLLLSVVAPAGAGGAAVPAERPKRAKKAPPDDSAIQAIAADVERVLGAGRCKPGSERWKQVAKSAAAVGVERYAARIKAVADAAQGLPSPAAETWSAVVRRGCTLDNVLPAENGWTVSIHKAIEDAAAMGRNGPSDASPPFADVGARARPQNASQRQRGGLSAWATTWGDELEEIARGARVTIDATEIAPLALEVKDG